jgi:hypothetical protein
MVFRYTPRSDEQWSKAGERQNKSAHYLHPDVTFFQPKEGQNIIRILPPTWEDANHYGLYVSAHSFVGPDQASVLCLNKMEGKRCPICEARVRLEGRGADEESIRQLKPTDKVVVWLIDRQNEEKGPLVWAIPARTDRDFTQLAKDPRTGRFIPYDDPFRGRDIYFRREGKDKLTRYAIPSLDPNPSQVAQQWLDYIAACPLPNILINRSYQEVKDIFEGGAPDDDEVHYSPQNYPPQEAMPAMTPGRPVRRQMPQQAPVEEPQYAADEYQPLDENGYGVEQPAEGYTDAYPGEEVFAPDEQQWQEPEPEPSPPPFRPMPRPAPVAPPTRPTVQAPQMRPVIPPPVRPAVAPRPPTPPAPQAVTRPTIPRQPAPPVRPAAPGQLDPATARAQLQRRPIPPRQ